MTDAPLAPHAPAPAPGRIAPRSFSGPLLLVALLATTSCIPGLRASAAGRLAALPEADSLAILAAAKADQKNFEITRRIRLPFYFTGTRYPRCAEVLGRYCLETPIGELGRVTPEEEGITVGAARRRLIAGLGAASARLPGDQWIRGQWVRYLGESGNWAGAITAAEGCTAAPEWWCYALRGYALHYGDRPVEADVAFRMMLGAGSPELRAAWLSPLLLLDDTGRAAFLTMSEEELASAVLRFWTLADPFWTREGNELLSEYFSRWVEGDLMVGTAPIEGSLWGMDLIEILFRYGIPPQWIRAHGAVVADYEFNLGQPGVDRWAYLDLQSDPQATPFTALEGSSLDIERSPSDVGPPVENGGLTSADVFWRYAVLAPPRGIRDLAVRYTLPPQSLLPPAEVFLGEGMAGGVWDAPAGEFPFASFNIPMGGGKARWLAPLAHQLALFPRGDSTVVVAGYDLPAHGVSDTARVEAALALLPNQPEVGDFRIARDDRPGATGVLALTVATVPSILSLEVAVPDEAIAARRRTGLDLSPRPQGLPALSDLLLLEGGFLPDSLSEAIEVARPSLRALPGEGLGIYWEMHGLDLLGISEARMTLTLHPPPSTGLSGLLRSIGEAIRVVSPIQPLRTEWVEEIDPGPFTARSLEFRFPESEEGVHLVELKVDLPGREPLVRLARVEVTRSTVPEERPRALIRRPILTRIAATCGLAGHRCWSTASDPSIYGHYGGSRHLSSFGYDGW